MNYIISSNPLVESLTLDYLNLIIHLRYNMECLVLSISCLNYNEILLSNTNVIFQIIFCQVTVLKNPEVKPDDLDALS